MIVLLIVCGVSNSELRNKALTIETDEYVSNAELIRAQKNAKESFRNGEKIVDGIDEYMLKAPDIKPNKGHRLKSPSGHIAYYFENETGEPFLVDDANNLWIWAGIDVSNPNDDWLVRTPDGTIMNFFVDSFGQLQSNFIGNEKDLRVVTNTNLGTIVAFITDGISDLHFKEIPSSSLQYYGSNSEDKFIIPPPLLEEGFVHLKTENFKEPQSVLDGSRQSRFLSKKDPFLEFVDCMDWENKDSFGRNEKRIGQDIKKNIQTNNDERNKSLVKTLKGIDVKDLPKALDYSSML
jgi:hypothetical protein